MTCVYKKSEVKAKMLQEQWLQLKMKLLLRYNMKKHENCYLMVGWKGGGVRVTFEGNLWRREWKFGRGSLLVEGIFPGKGNEQIIG